MDILPYEPLTLFTDPEAALEEAAYISKSERSNAYVLIVPRGYIVTRRRYGTQKVAAYIGRDTWK